MIRRSLCVLALCGCSAAPVHPSVPAAAAAPGFVAQAGDIAIVDASVVPMTSDGALAHHTVVIRGDRIAAIAPREQVQLPAGVTVIDGAGKWLMPGLADMHVHTWADGDLALFLAAGVTTIRNMWGVPMHLAWRQQIARGERLGPTIVTSGNLIDGAPPDWAGSTVLANPDDAEALVVAQKAAGYDFVKVVAKLSPAAYTALTAAAARHAMTVVGHVSVEVGLDGALAAHQRSIEHVDGYLAALVPPGPPLPSVDDDAAWTRAVLARLDPTRLPGLVERTIAAGTWNCPTLINYDRGPPLHSAAELAHRVHWLDEISAARRVRWLHQRSTEHPAADELADTRAAVEQLTRIAAALAAAGAPILVGTDTGGPFVVPGESLHDEIELLVAAGMPRPRVLRAATADAWQFFGKPDEAGVVEVGARADLILVASDPLTAPLPLVPDGVMVRGRWLPRGALTAMLAEVKQHDAPPSQHWAAAAAPYPAAGPAAIEVPYSVMLDGTEVAAERVAIAGAAGARTITGRAFDPGEDVETTYRLSRDHVAIAAAYHTMTLDLVGTLAGGAFTVIGTDLSGAKISLRAPAPADAFLAGPGIGGAVPLVDRLAGMAVGAKRRLRSIELSYYPTIAISSASYEVVRRPDSGDRRVFAMTTTRDGAAQTSQLTVDREGALVERTESAPIDTVTTRRSR